jgi:hypothetical protein
MLVNNPPNTELTLSGTVSGGHVNGRNDQRLFPRRQWPINAPETFSLIWNDTATEMRIEVKDAHMTGGETLVLHRAHGYASVTSDGGGEFLRTIEKNATTPYLHNVRWSEECLGPREQWCYERTTIRIDAPAGTVLANPTLNCTGFSKESIEAKARLPYFHRDHSSKGNRPPCHTFVRKDTARLIHDGKTAIATIDRTSWGLDYRLQAEVRTASSAPSDAGTVPVFIGKSFVIDVPAAKASRSAVHIHLRDNVAVFGPSDSTKVMGPYVVTRVISGPTQGRVFWQFSVSQRTGTGKSP